MERHDDYSALLTDYVLGELGAEDRRRVDEHLAHCAECAAQARELGLAFQGIGFAAEPIAPRPELRARVLATLSAQQAGPSGEVRRAAGVGYGPLALAAGLAALALGGALIVSYQRSAVLQEELTERGRLQAKLEKLADMGADREDLAAAILTAPDTQRVDLAPLKSSLDTVAQAYWHPKRGLLLVVDRMPKPPPGRVYHVWLSYDGGRPPTSVGSIQFRSAGRGVLIAAVPRGFTGGPARILVTDEPEGGPVGLPTGNKYLVGP